MDGESLAFLIMAIAATIGPLVLLWMRRRRIRRYGVGGGEFNHPFAHAGYGGVPPGTSIQEDFGGATTTQPFGAADDGPDGPEARPAVR
ncbi:hypothetical protein HLB23_27240 [Nocardia uniformis]|uniref:Uncharacterized protein n=1 Tax=Nocardia uniformis TaxID=53432 RepID=A0A849CBY6_9NOCA|nr:hypothetical protein [Nocardia uniformis]NNH73507.1 hypothetical protein [Nocardia uniformis]